MYSQQYQESYNYNIRQVCTIWTYIYTIMHFKISALCCRSSRSLTRCGKAVAKRLYSALMASNTLSCVLKWCIAIGFCRSKSLMLWQREMATYVKPDANKALSVLL